MAEYIEREALMKNFCGYDLTKCVKYGNENAEQQHDSYSTITLTGETSVGWWRGGVEDRPGMEGEK